MYYTPKVEKGAVIRAIVLLVMLINTVLAMFGIEAIPIGEEQIEGTVNAVYAAISAVALIVTTFVTYWKNNNITKKARIKYQK